MMHCALVVAALLGGADALLGGVLKDLNVPPFVPPGQPNDLSGNALDPQYYKPIEVEIYNPTIDVGLLKERRRVKRETALQADQPSTGLASALYSMTNDPQHTGNYVNTFLVNQTDGALILYRYYQNGGFGAEFNDRISTPTDFLDSQGPIRQAGSRLFAVNAANNTFQAYAVNCTDPSKLIYLGDPVQVNGDYPTSLTIAYENQIVCVGTTGYNAGIECFNYNTGFGSVNPPQYFTGTNVSYALPDQQGPGVPTGPADTLSQLLFTDDEKYLLAIVKGSASYDNDGIVPGYINVYPIGANGLGNPVSSTPTNTQYLFGCSFVYGEYNLFCADSGAGTFLLQMNSTTLEFSVIKQVATAQIHSGSIPSWTTRSRYSNGPFYMSSSNTDYIAAFEKSSGSLITTEFFSSGMPQFSHLTTANDYVYALSFGNQNISTHLTISRDTNLAGNLQQEYLYTLPYETNPIDNTWVGLDVFVASDEYNTCDFV